MINKVKGFVKGIAKNSKQYALCAVVAGGLICGFGVNAYAFDDGNTGGETVIEYIDNAAFNKTMTNVLDEGIDDTKSMLVPLIVASTVGGISVGLCNAIGRVVTKKVMGIVRRA